MPLVIVSQDATVSINNEGFLKLICCSYLEKHVGLFKHLYQDPVHLWNTLVLCVESWSQNLKDLLEWFHYNNMENLGNISQFSDLTRRTCYFNSHGTTDLFKCIMPSDSALLLHKSRGEYILQMVMESCIPQSKTYLKANEG